MNKPQFILILSTTIPAFIVSLLVLSEIYGSIVTAFFILGISLMLVSLFLIIIFVFLTVYESLNNKEETQNE
jgi:hypothetical protein